MQCGPKPWCRQPAAAAADAREAGGATWSRPALWPAWGGLRPIAHGGGRSRTCEPRQKRPWCAGADGGRASRGPDPLIAGHGPGHNGRGVGWAHFARERRGCLNAALLGQARSAGPPGRLRAPRHAARPVAHGAEVRCCINLYAHTTPLCAQIAEWHVRKDLCNKTVRSRVRFSLIQIPPAVCRPLLQVCVAHGVIAWELGRAKSRDLGTENSRQGKTGLKGAARTRGLQFCCINLYA